MKANHCGPRPYRATVLHTFRDRPPHAMTSAHRTLDLARRALRGWDGAAVLWHVSASPFNDPKVGKV